MSQIEFLSYDEINEGKNLGTATVRIPNVGKFCYRVVERKDGSGFFVSAPQYLRDEKWCNWFSLDSETQAEDVKKTIYHNVKEFYKANGKENFEEMPF